MTVDLDSPLNRFFLFLAGLVFFRLIYFVCKRFVHGRYPALSRDIQLDIASNITSGIQGVLSTLVGFAVIVHCYGDILHGKAWFLHPYGWFFISYFVYDLQAMLRIYAVRNKRRARDSVFTFIFSSQRIYILHHVGAILLVVMACLQTRMGDFVVGCCLCMELSTPFVSARLVLSECGLKQTRRYVVNAVVMMVLFFLCRIVSFPVIYWMFSRRLGIAVLKVPFAIPAYCNIGCGLLLALQLYWFGLMVRGLLKMLRGNKQWRD